MKLTINGTTADHDVATIADLVRELRGSDDAAGVAVALNETVVPKQQWRDTQLQDGDRIEVITAVQGG